MSCLVPVSQPAAEDLLSRTVENPSRYQENRQAFLDKYGAMTDAESKKDPKELLELAKSIFDRFFKLGRTGKMDLPTSWWERYKLYRGNTVQKLCQHYVDTASKLQAIAKELKEKEVDAQYPLQDLRNRCRRIHTLTDQTFELRSGLLNVTWAFICALNQMSLAEKILFKIVSLFHSIFSSKPSMELGATKLLKKIPLLKVRFNDLCFKRIKLGESEIEVKGQSIPIEVVSHFGSYDGSNFSGNVIFKVIRKEDKKLLGVLTLHKGWVDEGRPWGSFWEDVVGDPEGQLVSPHLCGVLETRCQRLPGEEETDYLAARLLIQVAMEVLRSEPKVSKLVIDSNRDDGYPLLAGGFSCQHNSKINARIWEKIEDARQRGLPLPERKDLGAFFAEFGKVHIDEPYVKYELNGNLRSWEQIIAAKPLLNRVEGPVLPKFLRRDLSVFEKPA